MTEKELKDWLKGNVERIIIDHAIIKMDAKKLPFRLELTALGLGIYELGVVIKVSLAARLVFTSNQLLADQLVFVSNRLPKK